MTLTTQTKQTGRDREGRLSAAGRRDSIARFLNQFGYRSVLQLAERLAVSEMTIRRDLDVLVADGLATRAHGGAVSSPSRRPASMDLFEPAVDERMQRNCTAKAGIGAAAAGLIGPNQTVAIDIGSTALSLACALRDRDVRIFTNSLKIAVLLATGTPRVYMPGGEVRGSEPSLVGALTRMQLQDFRFDWFFLGASGIAADGLYDYSLEDSEVKRALMARSARTVALIDGSKFDRVSIVKVTPLDGIHTLITDRAPAGMLADGLRTAGVAVCVTP